MMDVEFKVIFLHCDKILHSAACFPFYQKILTCHG